jgi:hypothetical protein
LFPNASWDLDAITFANISIFGNSIRALFLNPNNTIFSARHDNGQILIWRNGSLDVTTTIATSLSFPWILFATSDEQIFADNENTNNRVDRWTLNGKRLPSPMSICSTWCSGLFVDHIDNLYCSSNSTHQWMRRSLLLESSVMSIVAGTGCQGSSNDMLNRPHGICVTVDLDPYVSDYENDRVQLFREGQLNATTVAGKGSNETIAL